MIKKVIKEKKKTVLAVFFSILMFSSVFGLIGDYNPININNSSNSSILPFTGVSSLSETATINTSINYYTTDSVSNSASSSVNIPILENSSFSTGEFYDSAYWTLNSNDEVATWTQTLSGEPNYIYASSSSGSTIKFDSIAFALGYCDVSQKQTVGNVYANLSIDGFTLYWSHSFDFTGAADSYFAIITPNYNVYNYLYSYGLLSDFSSATLNLAVTAYGGTYSAAPAEIVTTTIDQGQNIITPTSSPTPEAVPLVQGYHYGTGTATVSVPDTETSFDISWSSPINSQVSYESATQTGTSGTITGNATSGSNQGISFTTNPSDPDPSAGTPDFLEGQTSPQYVTASYYLSSQYQAVATSATQLSQPSYTFSAVSGTTNEENTTFTFSASPPSGDIFSDYGGSLTTSYTPTITVSNPYYSYAQNQLAGSINGETFTSSNIASPSFTGNAVSYTTSASPSWKVDLNIYGNIAPKVTAPTIAFKNSGSEIAATFTVSQNVFSGELQDVTINWGDGLTSTYNNLTANTYTYYHNYTGTYQGTFSQTYSPYITVTNVPNPTTNGLSGLTTTGSSTSYTFGMTDNPTTPDSILKVGQSIYMNITATNLIISGATVSVNGLSSSSAILTHSGNKYNFKFSSTVFGVSGVTVTWKIDPTGIIDTFTTQYATPIEPTQNSSYVTALFSNKATNSYPIELSGVPSGTGYYQQLITINNPADYGINLATGGSNIQFSASNGTLLYAWIQSINSSAIQVWVKNYNGSSTINLEVLPYFENLLSSIGYLGEAPQLSSSYAEYDNGKYVFVVNGNSYYWNFAGTSYPFGNNTNDPSVWVTTNGYLSGMKVDNGLTWVTNINLRSPAFPSFGTADLYTLIKANQSTGSISVFNTQTGDFVGNTWDVNSNNSLSTVSTSTPSITTSTDWNLVGSGISLANNLVYSQYNGQTSSYTLNLSQYFTSSSDTGSFGFYLYPGSKMQYAFYIQPLPNNKMPTYSIEGGSVFQANSTADNTTYQHYQAFGEDSTNLTEGEYTYDIPDSFNSNYITIYYNPAWKIDYASYGFSSGVEATTNGYMDYLTFSGVSGIGTLTMTFTEPLVIGQPLGTMSLGVLPSIAVDGNAFFELPNDLLHWTASGVPVNPSGFSVVVGKPLTLVAYTAGGTPVFNETYTPTKTVTFLQTYVNVTAFQFNNLNSTDEVEITATNSQNVTQTVALVGPYGTGSSSQTVYLPSGKYTLHYTELNYTTGQVVPGTSTAIAPLAEYNGEYWVTLSGLTVFQLGNQLKYTNSSIQKSIQSLSVIISLNDSAIKNLTLGVDLNLTATNSSIQKVLQNILVNDKFINDTILNENLSLQARLNTINSVINSFQSNITVLDTYINDTVNVINKLITTVNTNLTTANSIIGEIKIIDSQNFTALNSTVKNNYVSLVSNQLFIESLVNSSKTSIIGISNIINSTVHDVSTNVTLFQVYVKNYINATVNNIKLQENFMNDTINKVNNNITLFQTYVKTTINTTLNNVQSLDIFINTTVKKVNNNVTLDEQFVNDSIHIISNNLTLFNNYVHTTINSTLNSISLTTTITDSIVHDVSTNVTLFDNYVHDTINTTITNIRDEAIIINSTIHYVSNNLTLLDTYVKDTINTTITNIKATDQIINTTVSVVSTNLTLLQKYDKDYIYATVNNIQLQENFMNTTLLNVQTNINTFSAYVHDTINATITNIKSYDTFINSTVSNIDTNLTLYEVYLNDSIHTATNNITILQNYVKDNINATINNIKTQEDFMNNTLGVVETNLSLFQTYVKSTINDTITNIYDYDVFIESTIKNLNNNVTLEEQFVNDSVNRVSNNLTLFNNYVRTTINSTITSISLTTSIINSVVHDVSTNITLFNNYVRDTINATITDIHNENLIINSTIHAVSTNVSLFQTYVKDTINITLTDVNLREQYINNTVDVISNNVSLLQTYTKDVIHAEIDNLSVITKYLNDTMGNMNISFNDKVAIINSTLSNMNLNSTTYFQIEHDVLNSIKANQTDIYKATELSGAYSYKLIPENSTLLANGVKIQLWVTTHDGTIVNNSKLVYFLWQNLSAEIISLNNQTSLKPTLISYNAHEMTVLFPLSNQQRNNIINGVNNTVLQLYAPFATGGVSNIATGSINPTDANLGQVSGIWATLGFTSNPPYSPNAMKEIELVAIWAMQNAGGRLIAGLVAILTILYVLIVLADREKKKKTEMTKRIEEEKTNKEILKGLRQMREELQNRKVTNDESYNS